MKAAGFLRPNTDPEELTSAHGSIWMAQRRVEIKGVEVEKIAGGGDPPKMDSDTLTALSMLMKGAVIMAVVAEWNSSCN